MTDHAPKWNRVGLIIGIAVVLLLFAGLYFGVQDNPFRKPALTFSIRFDDVTGIRERSKVLFLGIPIGYVTNLDYAPESDNSSVKVSVVVTRRLEIPATVEATLQPTLLGDASIALRLPVTAEGMERSSAEQGVAALADGAEIRGQRATRLEAVMPGFDEAAAKLAAFGAAAEQRLSTLGEALDRGITTLTGLFMEKDAAGSTQVERLIGSLQEIVNGPEGRADESLRVQLQTIIGNLKASSESVKRLANVQGDEAGSIGRVLTQFEEVATKLSRDADSARVLMSKMSRSSEAVTRASDQVNVLATKATDAVQQFHSRPYHYLTTTRPPAKKPTPESKP
jgi:ABC-type transporter Mla subunit MlaD